MNRYLNHWLLLPVLLIVTVFYLGHFDNSFHFDDTHTIEENPWIRDLSNIGDFYSVGAETFSTLPQNQMYRPLVTTTLAIDYALSERFSASGKGYDTLFYHLDSFFWFLVVIILVYLLVYRVIRRWRGHSEAIVAAVLASLLYGLHGAIGETVNYISARSDILSTAGVLGGLAIYALRPGLRKFGIYLLPVVAGMFAKVTTAMFFPVLLAWIVLFESEMSFASFLGTLAARGDKGKTARRLLGRSVPALIVIILCSVLTWVVMKADTFYPSTFSRTQYLLTQPWVILRYFYTFIIPAGLSADSDWTVLPGMGDLRFLAGFLFILALVTVIFITSSRRNLRLVSFGLAFFLFTLLPTSSVFPLAEVTNDHRIFLPYTGLVMAFGQLFILLQSRFLGNKAGRPVRVLVMLLLVGWYGFQTITLVQRNKVWQDEQSLWKDVTVKSPGNGRGLMNYGLTLMSDANYEGALSYFTRALEFNPQYAYLHTNLAICYNALGDEEKAEEYFRNALRYGDYLHEVHYFYARFLSGKGRVPEAIGQCRRSLELSPAYLSARYLLMQLYYGQQAYDKALALAEETLDLSPGDEYAQWYIDNLKGKESKTEVMQGLLDSNPTREGYLELSLELYRNGDYNGCIEACRKALEIDPQYAEAYNNICSAYNMMSMWDEAAEACEQALRINPGYELARNNLKYARASSGR